MVQKKRTSSNNTSNTPQYETIPQDIMDSHILPKLPVKSIIRFKSISKHYNSLISSPTFAKNLLQLHLNSASPSIFIQTIQYKHAYSPSKFLTIDIEPEPELELEPNAHDHIGNLVLSEHDHGYDLGRFNQVLIGSCNWLICMRLYPKKYNARSGKYTFFMIWNPMTSETRVIKFPYIPYQSRVICSGFGYTSSSDDYTIVALVQDYYVPPCVYLFSLRSTNESSWRKVKDPKLKNMSQVGRPTLGGETLYWLQMDERNSDNTYILAFDLVTKSWSFLYEFPVPFPDDVDYHYQDNINSELLCEIKQRLCVCRVYDRHLHMQGWMLERCDAKEGYWNPLFNVRNLETGFADECHLFVTRHRKDMVFIISDGNLISAHAQDADDYHPTIMPLPLEDGCFFKRAVNYTGSLMSPFYNWSYHSRTRKGKKNCLDAFKKKAGEYF